MHNIFNHLYRILSLHLKPTKDSYREHHHPAQGFTVNNIDCSRSRDVSTIRQEMTSSKTSLLIHYVSTADRHVSDSTVSCLLALILTMELLGISWRSIRGKTYGLM